VSVKSDSSIDESRHSVSHEARALAGMIRRVAVTLTSSSFWQVVGHLLIDGKTKERREVEVFSGIGFDARPSGDSNAEGIMANVGGMENPILLAHRDEDARKLWPKLRSNETRVFTRKAAVTLSQDPIIEARSIDGVAVPLSMLIDLQNAIDKLNHFIETFNDHTHVAPALGGVTSTPAAPESSCPDPTGTSVFMAE
jgi:hypothetical protein